MKLLGWIGLCFLLLPLIVVVLFAINTTPYISFPPGGVTFKWFFSLFSDSSVVRSIQTSLVVGAGVAALSTVLGTPAAIWLWRSEGRLKELMNVLILAPLLTPLIVLAVAIYSLYSVLHLIGSIPALVVAQTTLGLPMVVTAVSARLATVNHDLEHAAAVLGARPMQTLVRVTVPMAAGGAVTGFILAFGASFDELLIALFVGGIQAETFPVKIWERLRTFVNPEITAAAVLLMAGSLFLLLCVFIVSSLSRSRKIKT